MQNEKIRAAMEMRRLIREWFWKNGFLEVETPTLLRFPGQEAYLYPFETTVIDEKGGESRAYLRTSPEYAHKKLLARGFEKIFELARCFRNREASGGLHNPEFALLEWYRAGADYRGIMEDAENLISGLYLSLGGGDGEGVDFSTPWPRLSVCGAFRKYAGIDLNRELGRNDFDDWFFKIFLSKIEKNLGRGKPVILYDYPASMAALAELKKDDPRYAERFEIYIEGVELANAFTELRDPREQRRRFLKEQDARRARGEAPLPIDEEFLSALANLPPSGGIALGVDRLAMILLGAKSIREVMFL